MLAAWSIKMYNVFSEIAWRMDDSGPRLLLMIISFFAGSFFLSRILLYGGTNLFIMTDIVPTVLGICVYAFKSEFIGFILNSNLFRIQIF